jgi:hypothetical protein
MKVALTDKTVKIALNALNLLLKPETRGVPVMTNRQIRLLEQLESSVRKVREAVEDGDSTDCIDWGITVQVAMADLMATVIGNVHNRRINHG